nr:hypothetical protein [Planctomycetota bacterium]
MATTSDPPSAPPHRRRSPDEPSDVGDFLDDLHLRRRIQTARTASPVLLRLAAWLRERAVDAVGATTVDLQAYQSYLVSEYRTPSGPPLARSTVSTHIAIIKGWYRWLA